MDSRIISEVVDRTNDDQMDSQTNVSNQPKAPENVFDLSSFEKSLNGLVDPSPVELSHHEADVFDLYSEELGKIEDLDLDESQIDRVSTVYRYTDDVNAASKDPLIFGKNLFIPASFIKGCKAKEDTVFLVVSPDYVRERLGLKADKVIAFLEERCVKYPNSWTSYQRSPVIEGAAYTVIMRIESRPQVIRVKNELAKMKQLRHITRPIQKPEKKRKSSKEDLKLDDEIVVKAPTPNLDVKLKHAMSLLPKQKVYDSVLNYFLMKEFQDMKGYPGMIVLEHWVWISICYTVKATPYQEDQVYQHIKKLNDNDEDFTKIKYIALPVLVEGHWILVLICNPFPSWAQIEKALLLQGDVNVKSADLYKTWIVGNLNGPKILVLDSMYALCMDTKLLDMAEYHAELVRYVKGGIEIIHKGYFKHAGHNLKPDRAYDDHIQFKTLDVRGQNQDDRQNDCAIYCIRYLHTLILLLRNYGGDNVIIEDEDEFWYALFTVEEKITRRSLLEQIYTIAQGQKCQKRVCAKIRETLVEWK